ncbi:hypothetical protein EW095_10295 [Vibrio cholerae]|nr:hypothetical protein [Vibrio cholerae]EGR0845087.1 hypothetical protein [Vibrio cholerae]EGR0862606.1 hypothetical protein [Vibrio cholerae]
MSNITKSDLKSFSKVMSAIVDKINSDPDSLLSIFNDSKVIAKKEDEINTQELERKIEEFGFFDRSTLSKFEEIEMYLNEFESKELAYINKYLKFPYNRSKSKKTLINDIIDQLRKRTESVFRHHE